jgi:hypothetical protein
MTFTRKVGNFDNDAGAWILSGVILDLKKSIAYFLAEENRRDLRELWIEEFAAAIDLLAIMGEYAEGGPDVKLSTVQHWREIYFPIFDQEYFIPDEPDPLREAIVNAFDRLEAIAKLRPPYNWKHEEE